MNKRIQKLISFFEKTGIDGLIVSDATNLRYLLNYPCSDSWLFITPNRSYYITDGRYFHEVKAALKNVTICLHQGSLAKVAYDLAKNDHCSRVGFESAYISVAEFKKISDIAPKSLKLVSTEGLVEKLRRCKDKTEITLIEKALTIHKQSLTNITKYIKTGVTEKGLLERLTDFVRSRDVQFSFPPIIASGPNSSFPHARVTNRKLGKNDILLVDTGIEVGGYKSDLTRMFYLGKISKLIEDTNSYVFEANRKAISKIRPGTPICELDKQARGFLAGKKLDKYFSHALGHGVGLEIHEAPRLSSVNQEILEEGMVITIEPAVYLPHQFGIRIEDMVLVTKQGCRILSDNIH